MLLICLAKFLTFASSKDVQRTAAVVAADEVHQRVTELRRVNLLLMVNQAHKGAGGRFAHHKVENRLAHGVVHHAVERVACAVAARFAVSNLVARVLPHFAQDNGFRVGGLCGGAQLAQEVHRQFVRHIQPPAAAARLNPTRHNTLVRLEHELLVFRIVLAQLRQGENAPPCLVVFRIVVEGVPVVVGGGLPLIGAERRIMPEVVEVHAVFARVGKHAVEHHADADFLRRFAQFGELRVRAAQRVNLRVVARVVAVIRPCAENRVQVDDVDTHVLQVGQLLLNAGQRAPVEIQFLILAAAQVAHAQQLFVPVFVDIAVFAVINGFCWRMAETVGENLVDIRPVESIRRLVSRVVERNLEGFRLAVVIRDTDAAKFVRLVAIADGAAVLAVNQEVIPEKPRRGRQGNGNFPDMLSGRQHGVAKFFRHPSAQDDARRFVAVQANQNIAASRSRAGRCAIKFVVGIVQQHDIHPSNHQ